MKKLLLITLQFPPVGEIGVKRVLKFSKYLPEYNWTPVILTLKEKYADTFSMLKDQSLLDQVDKTTKVYRTAILIFPNLLIHLKKWSKNAAKLQKQTNNVIQEYHHETPQKRGMERLIRGIKNFVDELFTIPDKYIGWLPFALISAIRIIRRERIDLILSTSPPKSALLIGYIVKKVTRKPLVVDFRDPWTLSYSFKDKVHWRLRRKIEEFLERNIIKCADKVISISEILTQRLALKYSDKDKFITITNGFDSDDFNGIVPKRISEKFILAYFGSLYRKRTPEYFLKALRELIEENPQIAKDIKVVFWADITSNYKRLLEGFNLNEVLESVNWLAHKEAIEKMVSCDVLLLFIPKQSTDTDYVMTGKIFEYLGAKKPILAMVPPHGAAAKVIRQTNAGIVVDPNNPKKIKEAIIELYNKYKKNSLKFKGIPSQINKFSHKELSLQLAKILDSLTTK